MPAEIELKLAIDPAAVAATVAALVRHPALAALRKGRWRRARVVSTYLDTPDWTLAAAGVALRLRRDGVRWLQTVKGPPLPAAGGALHARSEYEWPVAGPTLDPARLATTPWRALLGGAIAGGALAPRFATDFERRSLTLAFADGTRAVLCIDVGEIRSCARARRTGGMSARRVPVAEVEIELATGNALQLFALAHALVADLPLRATSANKAARGQALVQGRPDGYDAPVRAGDVAFARRATAADAVQAIAVECLGQIAANAQGLAGDADPEWVHQMRIGTRRLRACLALAARIAPAGALEAIVTDIKWLAGNLGTARDWDVFATGTMPLFAARYAEGSSPTTELLRLRARIAARRRAAREAAREAVASRRFQQLVLGVGAWCATPLPDPRGAKDHGADPRARPAKRFARRVLERRHHRLVALAATSADGTPEERHRLRIAAKKLRYAAEFFASLLAGAQAAPYIKSLARLQDVLGEGNDAATAIRLAADVATRDDDAAAAALRGWAAARGAALAPELAGALKQFRKARRFWARR